MPRIAGIDKSGHVIGSSISLNYDGSVPAGCLIRDGKAVSRTTYAQLFAVIGTTHGAGDGSTTFNLPDDRGYTERGSTSHLIPVAITALSGNNVTATAHKYHHYGVPVQLTGTPPTGLSTGTTYWTIYVDDNTLSFATTQANALAGTAITLSGSAGGTIVQWIDPDSGSRSANAPGGSSSGVGTNQQDMFASHNHTVTGYGGALPGGGGADFAVTAASSPNPNQGPTNSTGGNESRGKNTYKVMAIAYI